MSIFLRNTIRFLFLMFIQVFVLDKIHLYPMVTPYIYYLFILWLPFNMNRTTQMILAFVLGFTLDCFQHNPGFHAAACVLVAYIRPFLINVLIPYNAAESDSREPSVKSMGGLSSYMIYAGLLTLIHHSWLFFLEAWQFGDVLYFISKTFFSTLISLALILITELLFTRKQKFRANTI